MDLTDTLAPKSDQLNAEDLLTGPRTVTIENVTKGSVEQPVDIHLTEFPGRPFRPSKTVRRILVAAWGAEASNYTGHRMTLYRDPSVRFGGMDVGGIRVSHLSHISKRLTLALTVSKGRRAPYVVEPLPDAPAPASDAFSPATREKWLKSMTSLLEGDGATNVGEQVTVIKSVLGQEQPYEQPDAVTDAELRTVVNTLGEWKKADTIGDKVAEILDVAAIAAESGAK